MAFQKGDKFRCSDATCGCEVEVTKGCAKPGAGGNMTPKCCCGKEMKKSKPRPPSAPPWDGRRFLFRTLEGNASRRGNAFRRLRPVSMPSTT